MREPDLFISTGYGDSEAVAFLNGLFLSLAEENISDLHLREYQGKWSFRVRRPDGMSRVEPIAPEIGRALDQKIRTRASIAMSERASALDGRMQLRYPDRRIDIRVAITPNVAGQYIVCRLLDQSQGVRDLHSLGLSALAREALTEVVNQPDGLFLVTGPTGSGKTTTLYSILDALNDGSRNIVTIENPVEYSVASIVQINVDQHITFAKALRTVLRQDPDVILVGEIRDAETADIAIQAAMTGHLVLATLHTNNAVQAPSRLADLGVDYRTLSRALRGVCAQRLVRKVVDAQMVELTDYQHGWLAARGIPSRGEKVPREEGATLRGTHPVMEVFLVDAPLREAIASNADKLETLVRQQPWYDELLAAAATAAFCGATTLREVRGLAQQAVGKHRLRLGERLVHRGVVRRQELHQALVAQIRDAREGMQRPLACLLVDRGANAERVVEVMLEDAEVALDVLDALERGSMIDAGKKRESLALARNSQLSARTAPWLRELIEAGVLPGRPVPFQAAEEFSRAPA